MRTSGGATMYYDPRTMTPHAHEALLTWLKGEGLVSTDIAADNFSVHNGRVSGHRIIGKDRKGEPVTVHFTQRQINPLPEELL